MYVNRKETPLKWLHIVRYVIQPIAIVIVGACLVNLICELFGIVLFPKFHYLTRALSYLSVSMNNLGTYFWPVVGLAAFVIFLFVIMIYSWVGLLRWRRYGMVCRHVYLTAVLLVLLGITYALVTHNDITYRIITGFLKNSSYNTITGNRFITVYFTIGLISYMVYYGLNFAYDIKRRKLFTKAALQEEVQQPQVVMPQETVQQNVTTPIEPAVEEVSAPVVETPIASNETLQQESEQLTQEDVNTDMIQDQPVQETPQEVEQVNDVVENMQTINETIDQPVEVDNNMPIEVEQEQVIESLPETSNKVENEEPQDVSQSDGDVLVNPTIPTLEVEKKQVEEVKQIFCPNCGRKLQESDVNFCTQCGYKFIR